MTRAAQLHWSASRVPPPVVARCSVTAILTLSGEDRRAADFETRQDDIDIRISGRPMRARRVRCRNTGVWHRLHEDLWIRAALRPFVDPSSSSSGATSTIAMPRRSRGALARNHRSGRHLAARRPRRSRVVRRCRRPDIGSQRGRLEARRRPPPGAQRVGLGRASAPHDGTRPPAHRLERRAESSARAMHGCARRCFHPHRVICADRHRT